MRRAALVALCLCLAGCGASAWQVAIKALEVAINVAREVHDHHLDGGAICETPVRDAGVAE